MIYAQAAIGLAILLLFLLGAALVVGVVVGVGSYLMNRSSGTKPANPGGQQVAESANTDRPEIDPNPPTPYRTNADQIGNATLKGCGVILVLIALIFLAYSCIDYSLT